MINLDRLGVSSKGRGKGDQGMSINSFSCILGIMLVVLTLIIWFAPLRSTES